MLYFTAVFSKLIAMLLSTIFMIGLPMAGMPAPILVRALVTRVC